MDVRAERIVAALGDASARWRDADFPARVRATRAIVERTGYTEPVVEYALDALFGELDAPTLGAAIASELGSVRALDGFVVRPHLPAVRYAPAGEVAILASRTTIGVAIPALAYALCAKALVLVKDREDHLVAAFAETIVEERPELRERIDVRTWDGAHDAVANARLSAAGVVVAYGTEATLRSVRERLAPSARFVGFGPGTSVGYVERAALADAALARASAFGLARDALLYDGEGCLSIHVAFVERGGALDPAAFATLLGDACDETAVEFPAGFTELDPAAAALRREALFRAAQGQGAVFGGTLAPHLVLLDPPHDAPPPWARRTIALYAIDGPVDAAALVRRFTLPLEAVATAPEPRDDVVAFALATGAARVARLGTLQRPPLGGEHGGVGRILPFVRAIYRD